MNPPVETRSATMTGAEAAVEMLRLRGVEVVFGTGPREPGLVSSKAVSLAEPALVDVVCQPLHEARAPVSEWVA